MSDEQAMSEGNDPKEQELLRIYRERGPDAFERWLGGGMQAVFFYELGSSPLPPITISGGS